MGSNPVMLNDSLISRPGQSPTFCHLYALTSELSELKSASDKIIRATFGLKPGSNIIKLIVA